MSVGGMGVWGVRGLDKPEDHCAEASLIIFKKKQRVAYKPPNLPYPYTYPLSLYLFEYFYNLYEHPIK